MTRSEHIPIKNIYYMLAYAFKHLRLLEYKNLDTEEFGDKIENMYAAILSMSIGRQIKQGLYKEYIERIEDLQTLRGKINMPGTMRNKIANRQQLSCEFAELSENNIYNRILKTASMLLIKSGEVGKEYKEPLKKEMLYFSDVDDIPDPKNISWSSIRFHRNNQAYQMMLEFCRLVFERLLPSEESGNRRMPKLDDERRLCYLYEKFILGYYQEYSKIHNPHFTASAPQIEWALDEGSSNGLPGMYTDVTLSRGDNVLIIDAKFYEHAAQTHYNNVTPHSSNLYQIFTYVKNKEAKFSDT